MRGLITFVMSILLFLNTVGVSVFAHYCAGDLTQSSILVNVAEPCCDDETEAESSCCHDEEQRIVIDDQFLKKVEQGGIAFQLFQTSFYAIRTNKKDIYSFLDHPLNSYVHNFGRPPDRQILFGNFRI